jgi:hypothetical protein
MAVSMSNKYLAEKSLVEHRVGGFHVIDPVR